MIEMVDGCAMPFIVWAATQANVETTLCAAHITCNLYLLLE